MKVAIMQPYLFPYIGYWQLINAVDIFVIYDNIEFSKAGWFHRNSILLNKKKTLFTVPLKKDKDNLHVVERSLSENSQQDILKILSQIKSAYQKAPYFHEVFPFVEKIFLNKEKNLFKYIYFSITSLCQFLDINTQIMISSDINIDHSLKSEKKVLAISRFLEADEYVNPIGGTLLYNHSHFQEQKIKLSFLKSYVPEYEQQLNGEYIPYLSIIDIMMFNNKSEIKIMLDDWIEA